TESLDTIYPSSLVAVTRNIASHSPTASHRSNVSISSLPPSAVSWHVTKYLTHATHDKSFLLQFSMWTHTIIVSHCPEVRNGFIAYPVILQGSEHKVRAQLSYQNKAQLEA
ncbi:hypothetical protein RRG08_035745, partial [Elysia crispata]